MVKWQALIWHGLKYHSESWTNAAMLTDWRWIVPTLGGHNEGPQGVAPKSVTVTLWKSSCVHLEVWTRLRPSSLTSKKIMSSSADVWKLQSVCRRLLGIWNWKFKCSECWLQWRFVIHMIILEFWEQNKFPPTMPAVSKNSNRNDRRKHDVSACCIFGVTKFDSKRWDMAKISTTAFLMK